MLGRAAILGQSPFFCRGFPKSYTKGVRRAAGRSIPLAIEVSAVKKLKCGCISSHPIATIRCPLLYVVLTKWRKGGQDRCAHAAFEEGAGTLQRGDPSQVRTPDIEAP